MATRHAHAAWCGLAGLLILTGQHRGFYALLDPLGLPDLVVSALTGLLGLAWYEIAYTLGGGLKNVAVFAIVPYVGAFTCLAAAVLSRTAHGRRAALVQLAVGVGIGGLALLLLGWRGVRGFGDPWRLVTTVAFLLAHALWFSGIFLARRREPAAADAPARAA